MPPSSSSLATLGYWLGRNRLYLQVTSRAPPGCTTLYQARGPGFRLLPSFTPITLEQEPTAQELANAVDEAYETDQRKILGAGTGMGEGDEGVVFAGVGEPLLRLDAVLEACELIKEARHGVPLVLNTTGLGSSSEDTVQRLVEAGLDRVSLFMPSANPQDYARQMGTGPGGLGQACEFLSSCVEQGITCRVVTINNGDGGSAKQVRDLGSALGAVEFEAKPYFK